MIHNIKLVYELSPNQPEMAVRTSGYELTEITRFSQIPVKKTQPSWLRRKERSIRYLIRRYRGLHNVKTRDTANYPDQLSGRLYGFAESLGLLQTAQLPIHWQVNRIQRADMTRMITKTTAYPATGRHQGQAVRAMVKDI